MVRSAVLGAVFFLLFLSIGAVAQAPQHLDVWVVAPSVSTSMESRTILRKLGWTEVPLRRAQAVLVVVRSSLSLPLRIHYDSTCELKQDADLQLNIMGPSFHVYVYRLADDMSVTEAEHTSYKADDRH
jgi:hypothetical protein